MGRKDATGTFIRDTCGIRLAGAGGNIVCLTADGAVLGAPYPNAKGIQSIPRKAIEEWNDLPAERRKPGAVKLAKRTPDDPGIAKPTPPVGGLILKQYYRMLADDDGTLRHVVLKDFVHHERLSKFRDPKARRHYFEAAPDFVWLTQQEWQSLIPETQTPGHEKTVDPQLAQRLFQFHLVPDITFGESNGWKRDQVRGGELKVVVDGVDKDRLRLKLEGSAQLGLDFKTAMQRVKDGRHSCHGYEPNLLGYIDYDTAAKRITRFDLVAVGDFFGHLYGDNRWLFRDGRTPLGVAFHLVTEKSPSADRQVVPRAMRLRRGVSRYFNQ